MNQSDAIEIKDTLDDFLSQFGKNDIYTQLTLEILFDLIYTSNRNVKNLPIHGPP